MYACPALSFSISLHLWIRYGLIHSRGQMCWLKFHVKVCLLWNRRGHWWVGAWEVRWEAWLYGISYTNMFLCMHALCISYITWGYLCVFVFVSVWGCRSPVSSTNNNVLVYSPPSPYKPPPFSFSAHTNRPLPLHTLGFYIWVCLILLGWAAYWKVLFYYMPITRFQFQ